MNKKFFLGGLGAIAIAGGVAFNYNVNAQRNVMPVEVSVNAEALASNEGGGDGGCPRNDVANTHCQIWKIIYHQGGGWPDISCETDPNQTHKCAAGTCPHGN